MVWFLLIPRAVAEPRGAFGEVPFKVLVLRSFWEMEGCGGPRESHVMGAVLPPWVLFPCPLDLLRFGTRSPSLAPFLQIPGFPLETLGGWGYWGDTLPGGCGMRKCQAGPAVTVPGAALPGNHIGTWLFQLSWKQLLLEPQPRARGPARDWVEYLGKPCFLSS